MATETLGLTEQSENLQGQIAAANRNTNALARGSRSSYMRPADVSLIKTFLERGKTESALRLALGHLKGLADNSLYPRLNHTYPSPAKLTKLIRTHKVLDTLIELAGPPAQASVYRLAQYGRICELLGCKQEAMAAYERAIVRDPKKPASRIQLALLAADTDSRNAAGHLLAIDRSYMHQVGTSLANIIRDHYRRGRVDQALDLLALIRDYLDLIQDSEKMNLDWVDQVAGSIVEPCFRPECQLNHLYQNEALLTSRTQGRSRQSSFSQSVTMTWNSSGVVTRRTQTRQGNSAAENAQVAVKRRTTHNQLCRKMLTVPQLAEAGFSRLVTEARARDALTDEYTEMARQAMLIYEPHKKMGRTFAIQQRNTYHNGQCLRVICPAEYLCLQAHRTQALGRLYSEFPAQLKRQNKTDQAAKLKHIVDLYIVSPDRFLSAADRFLDNVTANDAALGQPMIDAGVAIHVVIDAHLERHLNRDQDMGQFILDRIHEDIAKNSFVHQGAAEYWLGHLMKEDTASARVFLDSVLAAYNSPKGRISGLARSFQPYSLRLNQGFDIKTRQAVEGNKKRPARMNAGQNQQARGTRSRTTRGRGSMINRRRK